MKRWRYQLLVVTAIAVAGGIILSFSRTLSEGKTEALNQRLYALLDGPLAQAEGYEAPEAEIDQLIADSRGKPLELPILVRATNYYLDRAVELHEELAEEAKEAESSEAVGEKPDAETTEEKTARRDAGFAKVRSLVDDTETRFGDQTGIVPWAASVRAKIDGLLDTEWLPSSRTYAPPVPAPGDEPAADEATPEDAEAPVEEESVEAASESAGEAVLPGEGATGDAATIEEPVPEETSESP
jgi:hypothetical protein